MSKGDPIRTVRGTLRCPRMTRSPIEGLSCAIAWTVIEGLSRWNFTTRLELGTTGDLLVESDEGLYAIEPRGLWIQSHSITPQFPVAINLPAPLESLVSSSRIDRVKPLFYGESTFMPGDRIELRGIVRPAPCPFLAGMREPKIMPTLFAAKDRLLVLTELGPAAPRN